MVTAATVTCAERFVAHLLGRARWAREISFREQGEPEVILARDHARSKTRGAARACECEDPGGVTG